MFKLNPNCQSYVQIGSERLRTNLFAVGSKTIFCFVNNFFKTKYFPLIFILRERSRSGDAENGQTLDLTPSEPGDILTQKPCDIYVAFPALKG